MVKRLLAISSFGGGVPPNPFYRRVAPGTWEPFTPAPDFGGTVPDSFIAGLPGGGIILGGGGRYAHYDPYTGIWTYRFIPGGSSRGSAYDAAVVDDDEVYVVGSTGAIDKWDGVSWTRWANLEGGPGITYGTIAATAGDNIWCAGGAGGTEHLMYWDGAVWTNRYAEMVAAVGSIPRPDCVFFVDGVLWASMSTGQLIRYDGTWTRFDAGVFGFGAAVWGCPGPLVWVWFPDPANRIQHFDGVSFALQKSVAGPVFSTLLTRTAYGLDANTVACLGERASPYRTALFETVDGGANWTEVSWPDSAVMSALGAYLVDIEPPMVTPVSPTDGQTDVPVDSDIVVDIADPSGVDLFATVVAIDGATAWSGDAPVAPYSGSRIAIPGGYRYTLANPAPFAWSHTYSIIVTARDVLGNAVDFPYSFTIANPPFGPFLFGRVPAPGETGVAYTAPVLFDVLTQTELVLSTLDAYVNGALAVDGGVIQPGFSGSVFPAMVEGYGGYSLVVGHDAPFGVGLVSVRILASDGYGGLLDEIYGFRTRNRVESLACRPYETTLELVFSGQMLLSSLLDASLYQFTETQPAEAENTYVRRVEAIPADNPAPTSVRLWVEGFFGPESLTMTVSELVRDSNGDPLDEDGRMAAITPFQSKAFLSNTRGLVRSWHESRIILRDSLRAYLAGIRGLDVFDISHGLGMPLRWAQVLDAYGTRAACLLGTADFAFEDTEPPFLANRSPAPGQTDVSPGTDIALSVADETTAVEVTAVAAYVNGRLAFSGASGWSNGYGGQVSLNHQIVDMLLYPPPGAILVGLNTVSVVAFDLAGNLMDTSYTFTVGAHPPTEGGFGTGGFGIEPFGG